MTSVGAAAPTGAAGATAHADALHGPGRRPGSRPLGLERLLRYAATRGWVRVDRTGKYRATRTPAFLEHDHPGGWQAWIEFAAGGEVRGAISADRAGLRLQQTHRLASGDCAHVLVTGPWIGWTASPR